MRIIKFILVPILTITLCCSSYAQDKDEKSTSDYIEKYNDKLNLRLGLVSNVNKIRVTVAEDSTFSLTPNENLKLEIAAQYDFLNLSYSYTPNFIPGNNDDVLKGETSNRAFGVNIFLNRVFGRVSASNTKGYYLENTREIYPTYPEGEFVLYKTMQRKQLQIELGYNLNTNFSYKAYSIFNERQKISAGSFIPRIVYSKNKFEQSDDGSNHERTNDRLTISGNYVRTFVIRKHTTITFGLGLGGGVTYIEDRDDNEEIPYKNYKNSLVQGEFLLQIGHNSDRLFYGYSASTRVTGELETEIDNAFSDQSVISRFYLGYRFNPPKALTKAFEGIKYVFLKDEEMEIDID